MWWLLNAWSLNGQRRVSQLSSALLILKVVFVCVYLSSCSSHVTSRQPENPQTSATSHNLSRDVQRINPAVYRTSDWLCCCVSVYLLFVCLLFSSPPVHKGVLCPCRGWRSQTDVTSTRHAGMLWMWGWSEAHRPFPNKKKLKALKTKQTHESKLYQK